MILIPTNLCTQISQKHISLYILQSQKAYLKCGHSPQSNLTKMLQSGTEQWHVTGVLAEERMPRPECKRASGFEWVLYTYIYICQQYFQSRMRPGYWLNVMRVWRALESRLISVTLLTLLITLFQASAGCLMSTSISRKCGFPRPLSLQLSLSHMHSFTLYSTASNVLTSVDWPQTSPLRERGLVAVVWSFSSFIWCLQLNLKLSRIWSLS